MPEKNIGLGGIGVKPGRLRALRPDIVAELADSMARLGQLQPIVIRTRGGSGYWLVVGRHRLEAARKLKWPSIRANVVDDMKADEAELAEIDENLVRAELSDAERALHNARRKELYEKAHPETKRGGGPPKRGEGSGAGKHKSQIESFVSDTAAKTGRGRSTVARDITRAKNCEVLNKIIGTSLDNGSDIDALAKMPPHEQENLALRAINGEEVSARTELKKQRRKAREIELAAKQLALPVARYGVIVADPEWRFEPWSRETGLDRAADNHYPTSCTEVIAARDVPSIAADDCALFLWATVPMLPQALVVMAAWGFDYRSHVAWRKQRAGDGRGTGFWFINEHELCLLGIKGSVPCPAPGEQWSSVIEAATGKHSEKPEHFLALVEHYFPTLPKIELNRRGAPRPGWHAWGNEAATEGDSITP